jgi:hypothetical protein
MHQSNLNRGLKFCCGGICPSALATVCEQPFLLPYQYGTGNVRAALFSKTSSSSHAVFTLPYVLGQAVQSSSSWMCDSHLTWCTLVTPSTHIY